MYIITLYIGSIEEYQERFEKPKKIYPDMFSLTKS